MSEHRSARLGVGTKIRDIGHKLLSQRRVICWRNQTVAWEMHANEVASSKGPRLKVLKPGRVNVTGVGAGMQINDAVLAGAVADNRVSLSISALLDASKVTPGSTAPDVSLTRPPMVLWTSTTGVSPVTVIVSSSAPTSRLALTVVTNQSGSSKPSRLNMLKPVSVNVTE